jgi:hypothetical protein
VRTVYNKTISKRRCTFCKELLAPNKTVKEVSEMFSTDYHPNCYQTFLKQTNSLSGQFSSLLQSSRERAKRKGWDYDLSSDEYDDTDGIDFLYKLYLSQSKRCALTNLEFLPNDDSEWSFHRTISIDRKDSSIGYLKSNVQLVCQAVNYLKSNMTDDQVQTIAEGIIVTNRKKSSKKSKTKR